LSNKCIVKQRVSYSDGRSEYEWFGQQLDFGTMTLRAFPPLALPIVAIGAIAAPWATALRRLRGSSRALLGWHLVPASSALVLVVLLLAVPLPSGEQRNHEVLLLYATTPLLATLTFAVAGDYGLAAWLARFSPVLAVARCAPVFYLFSSLAYVRQTVQQHSSVDVNWNATLYYCLSLLGVLILTFAYCFVLQRFVVRLVARRIGVDRSHRFGTMALPAPIAAADESQHLLPK
jgi:hypothetical protein